MRTQPSMADIARAAGVSKNTVSLALRGSPRVLASTRLLVEETARNLGYRPNPTVSHLMAQLRLSRSPGFQATLALFNGNEDREAFLRHPTIPCYVRGCRERAARLGYRLDEFWMRSPGTTAERWLTILRARNIQGIVLIGLMSDHHLPPALAPLWEALPTVVTGVRTRDPALSVACSDHHTVAREAYEKALALGYQRPALVLDAVIDDLIEGRFTAGFLTAQSRHTPVRSRTRPFHRVAEARANPELFRSWLATNRPDVIFTLYHEVMHWLRDLGLRVPEDIGLIQYERRNEPDGWAGMDQRNDLVGGAALDMLVSMIQHNESGAAECPRATLIGPHWVDGTTVRMPGPAVPTPPGSGEMPQDG